LLVSEELSEVTTLSSGKSVSNAAWFVGRKPNPRAKLSLFCFPYAGGNALIYRNWHAALPPTVEVLPVQLPGRGGRMGESPATDIFALAAEIASAFAPELDRPFAFFGHSLGAMLSFELSRRLREERGKEPVHLFVSGRRAPHISEALPITYNLPEDEFVVELKRLNGTPTEVLENPELMQLMIPLLRADFQICETYQFRQDAPLSCPISAFGGLADEHVPREFIEGWRQHTSGPFKLSMLPGDHFFLRSSEPMLMQLMAQHLNRIVAQL